METVAREIARLVKPLYLAARVLEVAAIVGATIAVLVGLGLMGETHKVVRETLDPKITHPWVGAGIGVVLGAILLGLFFWAVARGLRVIAVDSAAKYGVPIVGEPLPRDLRGDVSPLATGSGRRTLVISLGCFAGFVLMLIAWSSR